MSLDSPIRDSTPASLPGRGAGRRRGQARLAPPTPLARVTLIIAITISGIFLGRKQSEAISFPPFFFLPSHPFHLYKREKMPRSKQKKIFIQFTHSIQDSMMMMMMILSPMIILNYVQFGFHLVRFSFRFSCFY